MVYALRQQNRIMKSLIIISIALLAASCGTGKNAVTSQPGDAVEQTQTDESNNAVNKRFVGTVRVDENDPCGVYIEMIGKADAITRLYPVNLEESMKIDFNKIKFSYALSRAKIPGGCEVDMTISVTNVERLR